MLILKLITAVEVAAVLICLGKLLYDIKKL